MGFDVKKLLYTAAYLPIEMERLLDPENPAFVRFDPELGYELKDYVFRDGMEGTLCKYTYETHGGHRKMINYRDMPCRINTYGNSYTQCAQVNDGETWQEILAAHIREPIRNFGVGGYGVYQAYLRAMRVEKTDLGADYIILNIWDDDHLRNIDTARWIRVAWIWKELSRGKDKSAYPVHGFPWAHIRYDLKQGKFVELPGICKNEDGLRKLADREYYYNTFKNDTVVHLYTIREGGEAPVEELEKLAEAFGLKVNLRELEKRARDARKLHLIYGIESTKYILDRMNAWAKKANKKLMILLSYDVPTVKNFIEKGERFDTVLLEYLKTNKLLYVDLLKKAKEDYKAYNLSVDKYLNRFYVGRAGAQVFGHYNPYGNFWFAFAIRKEIVNWLNPKPPTYE